MAAIRLAFVGDVMLHGKIVDACRQGRGDEIFAGVRNAFRQVDGTVLNLECAFPSDERFEKEPRIISSPEAIRQIMGLKPLAVCLANNHVFDCGRSGYVSLVSLLREIGVTFFGAGETVETARAGVIGELHGQTFGWIGYVDPVSHPTCVAGPDSCGVALYQESEVMDSIRRLRGRCDHIVVCLHWGQEHLRVPSPSQIRAARAFIDAGARFVIGHHAHVLQGVERYKDGLIAYGLGNFVTTEAVLDSGRTLSWAQDALQSCILIADLDDAGRIVHHRQIPVVIENGRVRIAETETASLYIDRANSILRRPVTAFRYKREYFQKRILNSVKSLVKRRGILFIRPRHFVMLLREIKALIWR